MGKALTKSQIAAHIASKFELKKKTSVEILEEIANLAYREAKNSFTLPGIGKLVLVDQNPRIGRNPATGAQIEIPAKTVVKFRVAKAAKEAILLQKWSGFFFLTEKRRKFSFRRFFIESHFLFNGHTSFFITIEMIRPINYE